MPPFLSIPLLILSLAQGAAARDGDWPHYGGDLASRKYAPLTQIHRGNVDSLAVAWRWQEPNFRWAHQRHVRTKNNQATPLVVDGVLYMGTALNQVFALDAATGRQIWSFDSGAWRKWAGGRIHRGVAYWRDGADERIVFATHLAELIALDAKTGLPVASFGDSGRVDLKDGLRRPVPGWAYKSNSPPLICRDVIVVGSAITDWPGVWGAAEDRRAPPGDVRGFDARTGELLWTFHTVPQRGEYGVETWEGGSWETAGGANVWTTMSADAELGYVYLPVSTPSNDFYGGERLGDNLFGESLVCLDVETGERVWHYQLVHHGLWDYDLPAAPILADIEVAGEPVKAVVQLTKHGFCFVFDRVTGAPVWPIEERPVPASTAPGERASPTQPFPTRPAPFDAQGMTADRLIDFTPALREDALAKLARYDHGPMFTPPSLRGTLMLPGIGGGADWAGGAFDPRRGLLFVPSHTYPNIIALSDEMPEGSMHAYLGVYTLEIGGRDGLPLTKPPYGRITAIDLNSGEHRWVSPTGRGPVDHPLLRDLDLPRLGWPRRTFAVSTPDLVLAAAQGDHSIREERYFDYVPNDPALWAYAPETGALLAEIALPDNAQGGLVTYMADGRQFVAVPTGTFGRPAGLVALALPRGGAPDPRLALPARHYRDDADHPLFYDAVRAFDRGDAAALDSLLAAHPGLARARGYLDPDYHAPRFAGATLLHHVAGEPQRARLPANAPALAAALLAAGAAWADTTHGGATVFDLMLDSEHLAWSGLGPALVDALVAGGLQADDGALLWRALARSRTALAGALAAHGAPPELRYAAGTGRLDLLESLLAAGGLPRRAYPGYRPPWAAADSGAVVVEEGLRPAGDQDVLDEALAFAALNGQVAAAALLLDHGARIDATPAGLWHDNDRGSSPLHKAARARQGAMLEFLLGRGADPFVVDAESRETPREWVSIRRYFREGRILREGERRAAGR